jgi:hypothetical protein
MRILLMAASLAGLSACGTFTGTVPTDPSRTVLGVVAHQAGAADSTAVAPDTVQKLEWKTAQLCTRGYEPAEQDVVSAEQDEQLVSWDLRCRPYVLSVFGVPLGGLAPSFAGF